MMSLGASTSAVASPAPMFVVENDVKFLVEDTLYEGNDFIVGHGVSLQTDIQLRLTFS